MQTKLSDSLQLDAYARQRRTGRRLRRTVRHRRPDGPADSPAYAVFRSGCNLRVNRKYA